jgi:hypothetical protein
MSDAQKIEDLQDEVDTLFIEYVDKCEEHGREIDLKDFVFGFLYTKCFDKEYDLEYAVQFWCAYTGPKK